MPINREALEDHYIRLGQAEREASNNVLCLRGAIEFISAILQADDRERAESESPIINLPVGDSKTIHTEADVC